MNRRAFLSGVALARMHAAEPQRELLLPSDQPDEFGFRLMWYSPVPALDLHAYSLRIGADKWYEYFTLDQMLAPRVLLVLDMAGKPLAEPHGAPLRVIDPARYGYKSAKLITSITLVAQGKGSMACDIGPYYTPGGEIQAGYDHPLDLGKGVRRKITGGEITSY